MKLQVETFQIETSPSSSFLSPRLINQSHAQREKTLENSVLFDVRMLKRDRRTYDVIVF